MPERYKGVNGNDWTFDCSEFSNSAHRSRSGETVDIELDKDSLEVAVEVGSGYLGQSTRVYIPLDVLVRMLWHAGYDISRPWAQTEEADIPLGPEKL